MVCGADDVQIKLPSCTIFSSFVAETNCKRKQKKHNHNETSKSKIPTPQNQFTSDFCTLQGKRKSSKFSGTIRLSQVFVITHIVK